MGRIFEIYGTDGLKMTKELMKAAGVAESIPPGVSVVLKPNLVRAGKADTGATTHPEVFAGCIEYLQESGISDISIILQCARRSTLHSGHRKADSHRLVLQHAASVKHALWHVLNAGYVRHAYMASLWLGAEQKLMKCVLRRIDWMLKVEHIFDIMEGDTEVGLKEGSREGGDVCAGEGDIMETAGKSWGCCWYRQQISE